MSIENRSEHTEHKIENVQAMLSVEGSDDIPASKNYIKSLPDLGWTGFKPTDGNDNLWTYKDQHSEASYLYKNDKLSHVRDFADTDITRDEKKANCFQLNYKNGNSETLNGDIRLQPNGNISIEDKGGRTLYQSLNGGGYVRRLYESNDPANHKCCELEYNGKELVGFTKADGNGFYVEPNGAQKIELKNNKVTVQFENKIEEYALLPEKRAAL